MGVEFRNFHDNFLFVREKGDEYEPNLAHRLQISEAGRTVVDLSFNTSGAIVRMLSREIFDFDTGQLTSLAMSFPRCVSPSTTIVSKLISPLTNGCKNQ